MSWRVLELYIDRSREWVCPACNERNVDLLPDPTTAGEEPKEATETEEARDEKPEEGGPATEGRTEERVILAPEPESSVPDLNERVIKDDRVRRPPVVLDGAICVVCVLLFALLCRRFI